MKTNIYSQQNYSTFHLYKKELLNEFKSYLIGTQVEVKDTKAYISDLEWADSEVKVTLDNNKAYILDRALASSTMKVSADTQDSYNEFRSHYTQSKRVLDEEVNERHRIYAEQFRLESIRKAEIRAKNEALKKEQELKTKRENRVKNALRKLDLLRPADLTKTVDTGAEYFEAIGWLAKHTTSITAKLPDYMDKWFVRHFGEVQRTVIDSKRTTSNGQPMQWGLSFKITFNSDIKNSFSQYATSKNKKLISNVSVIWRLIEDFNFNFGNIQDIEAIRQEIPTKYLEDFDRGYNTEE